MGIGAVLCTYLLVTEVLRNRALGLAAAAFQATIPGFLLTSSTVNNDNATNLFSALALLFGARAACRKGAEWRTWVLCALFTAAAVWSKLTGLFILIYFAGTLLLVILR